MQRVAAASAADEPPGLPAPPRADPWAIPDATPEILRELDREIAERGLSEPAARLLLVQGFAAEVTDALPAEALGERVREMFLEHLAQSGSGA